MAKVKTIETKRVNVEVEADWGFFKRGHSYDKEKNVLTIRFGFNALEKKLGPFSFRTTDTDGIWLVVTDLEKLRTLHKAIGETLNEVEKLTS